MIDEEKLEKLLEDNYGELYAALQKMNVDDFIAEYKDELIGVPGFIELYQNSTSNAPHNMTQEQIDSYFDKESEKEQYRQSEAQLAKELAKKQQLADEYRRAKDVEEFSKFRWQRPTKDMTFSDRAKLAGKNLYDNLIALGLTLTPQAAKNVYIKEGNKPDKIGAQAGIGTMANVAELVPGPGKAGKAIATVVGPAIRAGQDIYEGKDLSEVGEHFAFDTGLNTLFTYMPVKEAYHYAKRILGRGGEAGEKAIKSKADELLEQADLLENKEEALTKLSEQEQLLQQFQDAFKDMSDLERAKFIKDLENAHPDLAKALEEHTNALGENRFHSEAADYIADNIDMNDFMKEAYDDLVKEIGPEKAKQIREMLNPAEFEAFLEEQSAKRIAETAENVDKAFNTAKRRTAEKKAAMNDELFDEAGNLKTNVENLSEAAAYAQPNKFAQTIAKTAPVGRGVARNVVTPSRKSTAPEDKEYKAAIDWTIDKYKRQWDAGFTPKAIKGDLLYEAWKEYDEQKKKGK